MQNSVEDALHGLPGRRVRLDYVDLAKGLAMILVVAGHVNFGQVFSSFIHGFHVPVFFFTAGFCFNAENRSSLPQKLLKKAKALLVPYLAFGLGYIAIYYLKSILGFGAADANPFYYLFVKNTADAPVNGIQWFLTAMFFMYVFVYLLFLIKNRSLRYALSVIVPAVGILLPTVFKITLPLALGPSMAAVGMFMLGYLAQKLWKKLCDLPVMLCCVWFIIATVLLFVNFANMRTEKYGNIFLFWFNAVSYSTLILLFMYRFSTKIIPFVRRELIFIGSNSIVYLCTNEISIIIFSKIVGKIISAQSGTLFILKKAVILLCALAMMHVLTVLFTKTPLRIFIGRKNGEKNVANR